MTGYEALVCLVIILALLVGMLLPPIVLGTIWVVCVLAAALVAASIATRAMRERGR